MRCERPIVAIDGPVSAGKSTVARKLAHALGFTYLNTGAMYRAAAIAFRQAGLDPDDPELEHKMAPILVGLRISFEGERVFLNHHDVSAQIRDQEIGELASRFSTFAPVRTRMLELQREEGARGAVVMEGRDIGTAVFPEAEFKFFLDAQAKVRAKRRWRELAQKGASVTCEQVLRELTERDQRDQGRELAPLRPAGDALVVDTTDLSVMQVVEILKSRIQEGSV